MHTVIGTLKHELGYEITIEVEVHGDMAKASEIGFWGGIAYMVFGIVGIAAARQFARRMGKHKTLIVALLIGLVAFGSSLAGLMPMQASPAPSSMPSRIEAVMPRASSKG